MTVDWLLPLWRMFWSVITHLTSVHHKGPDCMIIGATVMWCRVEYNTHITFLGKIFEYNYFSFTCYPIKQVSLLVFRKQTSYKHMYYEISSELVELRVMHSGNVSIKGLSSLPILF